MRKKIILATHNAGKVRELGALLAPLGVECVSAGALNLPDVEETGETFAENALLKAHAAAQSGFMALADDSGLCVAALGGVPGIYSARWAGEGKDWIAAMAHIHAQLGDSRDRSAYFICVLALAWPDGREAVFEGRVEGDIVWPPRGTYGFGYDPIFVPQGFTQTFGEMAPSQKEALSHRTRAFAALSQSGVL